MTSRSIQNRAGLPAIVLLLAAAFYSCTPADSTEASLPGDIAELPAGEAVDLAAAAVPGKVTIYDFWAEWCAPCRMISPKLEELAREHPDQVALRTIDVIHWETDAATHQQIEYLPYLAVVDVDGNIAAAGDESFAYIRDRFGVDLMAALRIL